MTPFWRQRHRGRELEDELRASRPEPPLDLVDSVSARLASETRRARPARFRLAVAAATTAALLVPVAALGGFGTMASTAKDVVDGVRSALVADGDDGVVQVRGLSAGSDQYEPGFGWGDPAANHEGPPGLTRDGAFAPPLVVRCNGTATRVRTSIVLDEQADLRISVLAPGGKRLLLSQTGSRVGGPVVGKQTKTIRYRVLVPRVLTLSLRIPCSVLEDGARYRLRVVATDPNGLRSTLVVPFRTRAATA